MHHVPLEPEVPAQESPASTRTSCAVFNVTVPKNVLADQAHQVLRSHQVPMAMRDKRRIRETLNQDRTCSAVQRRIMPRDDEHE